MYFHTQRLINAIAVDEPDPAAANALQEGLGGQFGEMRTMMQYLFQSINFRGKAKPYHDLIHAVAVEEISHVELIGTTISRLLDGAPGTSPATMGASKDGTPLKTALSEGNIHHFRVGAQGALPVDAADNPWSGSYVYNSGNLTLDLLYNLMLAATGRLQKCRIYEMPDNKAARSTIAFLIVRDHGHELVYAKALESLGVNWGKVLPIPNFDARQFPEVRALMDEGLHLHQHHWWLDGSQLGVIFNGPSPANNDEMVVTVDQPPGGVPMTAAPERPEEFAPGLPPELNILVEHIAALGETAAGL